ncbi:hypothetical protein J2S74_000421 [Evansella vedderi]|uniref:NERD domain-containing protein n=1 Tax=Evansella vedderi TaxID=38282 RepID=A0ABT9ZP82_9BACI|nr:nuclease-related domain-containing protein [Evansella vedderi]MDQ0253049.1 hypothetical protein [Evansella vedderi]
MTIIKPRSPSLELRVMSSLSLRMEFSKEEKERLYAIRKGYEGEVQFDKFYENCPSNWLVLNDLWLKNSNATFQIDSLLLTPQANYVFDIKNNEGEYELNDGRFYKNGSETRNNPLTQLQRLIPITETS